MGRAPCRWEERDRREAATTRRTRHRRPADGVFFPERIAERLFPADDALRAACRWAIDSAEYRVARIISPFSGENSRLVRQRGLFTKLSLWQPLEDWIRDYFSDGSGGKHRSNERILLKIVIPECERPHALSYLRRRISIILRCSLTLRALHAFRTERSDVTIFAMVLVNFSAMLHTSDAHALAGIVNDVDHAPITHPKAPLILIAFQFFCILPVGDCRPGRKSCGQRGLKSASSSASSSFCADSSISRS